MKLLVSALLVACVAQPGSSTPLPKKKQCDFPVIDGSKLTPEEFQERFVKHSIPVLIKNAMSNWPALENWKWENLRTAFRDVPLRVGPGPYPKETMSIDEYLDRANLAYNEKSGEVPGVFQYGQVPTSWSLWAHKDHCVPSVAFLHPHSRPIHDNYTIACELLSNIRVPDFLVGTDDVFIPPTTITHSGVLIGFQESGIDYHRHQAAINVVFHGQKEWFMKVRNSVVRTLQKLPEKERPSPLLFCNEHEELNVCSSQRVQQLLINRLKKEKPGPFETPRFSSNEEMELNHLGNFARWIHTKQVTEELEDDASVLHCVQDEGEIVFIPQQTQHAVRNTRHTVGMQMQWDADSYKDNKPRMELYRYLLNDLDPSEPDPDFDSTEPTWHRSKDYSRSDRTDADQERIRIEQDLATQARYVREDIL